MYVSEKVAEMSWKRRVGNYEEILQLEVRKDTLIDVEN